MKSKINFAALITIILFSVKISAQEHTNTWFRTTLSIPVTEKLQTDLEFQHRRQNNFESNNPLDKNLMNNFRTWIYYQQKEDIVFGLSPFAIFSHYKIIQDENDADQIPTIEYRFAATMELQHELLHKFFFVDRTGLEYRVFDDSVQNVVRLRNRLSFRYDVNPKFNISAGDEIFINVSGAGPQHIFDHDRLFGTFSFIPQQNLKIDAGYMYISRLPRSNTELLEESNFYINFTYTMRHNKSAS